MIRTISLAIAPLALMTTPALAAPASKPVPAVPQALSDPAMADKLGKMAGTLTRALMDMPVGELEAAIEGREPTAADRSRKVRDQIGGPQVERQVEADVAQSGKQMQAMGKALVASLPAIMQSLEGVQRELERATANIPDPTYPRQ